MDQTLVKAFRMQLKPGMTAEYHRRHAEIWPELTQALRDAGVYDYSIFLDPTTLQLFGVLKLRPDHRLDEVPQLPVMRRWWSYMADLMETEPDQRPRQWPLEPMFYLE